MRVPLRLLAGIICLAWFAGCRVSTVEVEAVNPVGLRVGVFAHETHMGVPGVEVYVQETRDAEITGASGWTSGLAVPYGADRVHVRLSWKDLRNRERQSFSDVRIDPRTITLASLTI